MKLTFTTSNTTVGWNSIIFLWIPTNKCYFLSVTYLQLAGQCSLAFCILYIFTVVRFFIIAFCWNYILYTHSFSSAIGSILIWTSFFYRRTTSAATHDRCDFLPLHFTITACSLHSLVHRGYPMRKRAFFHPFFRSLHCPAKFLTCDCLLPTHAQSLHGQVPPFDRGGGSPHTQILDASFNQSSTVLPIFSILTSSSHRLSRTWLPLWISVSLSSFLWFLLTLWCGSARNPLHLFLASHRCPSTYQHRHNLFVYFFQIFKDSERYGGYRKRKNPCYSFVVVVNDRKISLIKQVHVHYIYQTQRTSTFFHALQYLFVSSSDL